MINSCGKKLRKERKKLRRARGSVSRSYEAAPGVFTKWTYEAGNFHRVAVELGVLAIWTGYLYRRDANSAEKTGKERDRGIDTSTLIPLPGRGGEGGNQGNRNKKCLFASAQKILLKMRDFYR